MKKFMIELLSTILLVGTIVCVISVIADQLVSNNLSWFTGESCVGLDNFMDGLYRYSVCRNWFEDWTISSAIAVLVSSVLGVVIRLFDRKTKLIEED